MPSSGDANLTNQGFDFNGKLMPSQDANLTNQGFSLRDALTLRSLEKFCQSKMPSSGDANQGFVLKVARVDSRSWKSWI